VDRSLPARVDVAIVGSGPTGAAYARILSEESPSLSVAVFEAGPLIASPPGIHVKNIADPDLRSAAQRNSEGPGAVTRPAMTSAEDVRDAQRRARPGTFLLKTGYQQPGEHGLPAAAMSSNVGGMGAHWTGACPRPGDEERIPFLPDLDVLLSEAERLLHVTQHAFDDAPLSATVRGRLAAAFDDDRPPGRRVQPMPLAVERHDDGRITWSGSDTVFADVTRSNPNFALFPETLATRVLTSGGQVQGIHVRDQRTGNEHAIAARAVVVAADSLRTPQLLWASGVRPAALGRYLNDQPQVLFAVRLRDIGTPAGARPPVESTLARQSGVSWVPYTSAQPFHGQVMQVDASPVPLADADEPAPGSIVGLGWFCAKDLQPCDRIEFSDATVDDYSMPAMQVHYTLTGRDLASIEAAAEAVLVAADALGDPLDHEPFMLPPGSSLHYQGTVRMGPADDGTSVCGPTCEVWDVGGLYVAGNGVIPTATACNPTLTSVALAVAGARDIARRLEGKRPATSATASRAE